MGTDKRGFFIKTKNHLKLVVAGNATLDAYIDGRVYEKDKEVTVISDGVKRVFKVMDGPIEFKSFDIKTYK